MCCVHGKATVAIDFIVNVGSPDTPCMARVEHDEDGTLDRHGR